MTVKIAKTTDRYPITFTTNADLTGATVVLKARIRGTTTIVTLPQTITDPTNGVVTHVLDGTLAAGSYDIELEITQGASLWNAPTEGFGQLMVTPDLG